MHKPLFLCAVLIVNATTWTWGQQDAPIRHKSMGAALDALKHAGSESERVRIYDEIARLPLESPKQIPVIYDEAVALENRVKGSDQAQYISQTQNLCRSFASATDPKFSDELAIALDKMDEPDT